MLSRHPFRRPRVWGRALLLLIPMAGWGLAAWAGEELYSGWWFPANYSSAYGDVLDRIFNLILTITVSLAAILYLWLAYVLFTRRYRSDRKAVYFPGHRKFELAILIFFTVFIIGGEILGVGQISHGIWDSIRAGAPADAMKVEALAEQFAWNFRYPGPDGKFGKRVRDLVDEENPFGLDEDDPAAADDIVTLGELHAPVNRPVHVLLGTKDVIHSFFIPVLRIKQDALPGETIHLWFEAVKTGSFQLVCAELCGLGHSTMKARVVIETLEGFQNWLEEQKEETALLEPGRRDVLVRSN